MGPKSMYGGGDGAPVAVLSRLRTGSPNAFGNDGRGVQEISTGVNLGVDEWLGGRRVSFLQMLVNHLRLPILRGDGVNPCGESGSIEQEEFYLLTGNE